MGTKRNLFGIALIGAAVATASPATAGIVNQTVDIWTEASQFATFAGTFKQFNPSLGTLNAITLSFTGMINYTASYAFSAQRCAQFPALYGVNCSAQPFFSTGFSFNAPGFPVTNPNDGSSFFALTGWSDIAVWPNLTFGGHSSGPIPINYGTAPASFTDYIGKGKFDIVGGISEDSDFCFTQGVSCTLSNVLHMRTTLRYVYTPAVPEPATLALFSFGLLGSFALRRRHRR